MAEFYAGRVRRGKVALDDVPERLRERVEETLAKDKD